MRIQVVISDIKGDDLPEVVDAFFDGHVATPTQGRYQFTSNWFEDIGDSRAAGHAARPLTQLAGYLQRADERKASV